MLSHCSYLRGDSSVTKHKSKVGILHLGYSTFTLWKNVTVHVLETDHQVIKKQFWAISHFCFRFAYLSFALSFLSLGARERVVYHGSAEMAN